MPMEQNFYDGRRGHKRLKAIEKQIEKISGEFETSYADAPEMVFLNEDVRWEGPSRLIFMMAFRNVHFTWNGLRDYGFIRLCRKWILENRITSLTTQEVVVMIKAILPAQMCDELSDELSAMEIA